MVNINFGALSLRARLKSALFFIFLFIFRVHLRQNEIYNVATYNSFEFPIKFLNNLQIFWRLQKKIAWRTLHKILMNMFFFVFRDHKLYYLHVSPKQKKRSDAISAKHHIIIQGVLIGNTTNRALEIFVLLNGDRWQH